MTFAELETALRARPKAYLKVMPHGDGWIATLTTREGVREWAVGKTLEEAVTKIFEVA